MTLREWGLLLLLSMLWGGSFFFVEIALRDLPPLTIVWARIGVGAIVLWAALIILRRPPVLTWGLLWRFCLLGFLANAAPFSLLTWGQTQIGAGLASILNATTPLWTALIAHAVTTDEKLTPFKIAGVIVGVLGVALMMGPAALGGLGGETLAMAAVVGAALHYALATLFGRGFGRRGLRPEQIAAGQLAAAALLITPVALLVDAPWRLAAPSAATIASVFVIGAVSTAAAYLIFYRLLETTGATNLQLVTFLVPVTATTLGVLALDERFTGWQIAGVGVIALGLALFDGRGPRALARLAKGWVNGSAKTP